MNRTVTNYILWRFIMNRVTNLSKKFLEKQQEFHRVLHGTRISPERWKSCTSYVNKNLGMAVGSIFVKTYFNEESKHRAEEMINNIKRSFYELLEENDWMDFSTKSVARSKARIMEEKIGFPEFLLNQTAIDLEYKNVS